MSQAQYDYALAQAAGDLNRQSPPPPSSPLHVAKCRIKTRIAEIQAVRENYIGYLAFRKSESDWHGCWDASVNISETECEIAGLKFALEAMESG